MNRSLLLASPLTLAALALGCAVSGPDNPTVHIPAAAAPTVSTEAALPEAPPAPQGQIDMMAQARGNVVRFQIRSNSVRNLYVGPENFALISPGAQEPLLATDDQVVRRIVSTQINPGDQAAGELAFLGRENVVGHALLFNSNQTQPKMWRTVIIAAPSTAEARRR